MKAYGSRQVILSLVAFAVGSGSLLIAGSALAAEAMFRVERKFYAKPDLPGGASTYPGGAGIGESWIMPYVTMSRQGEVYYYDAPMAKVADGGNNVGAPFTLPSGFIDFIGTWEATPRTGWEGYSTYSEYDYYNGPGHFGPQNVHTGSTPKRIFFPTTLGNPTMGCYLAPNCNYGTGNPNLPTVGGGLCKDGSPPPTGAPSGAGCGTTTFDGRYDFSKAGSINVTPGGNQFGGTWNIFYRPNSYFYQFIGLFDPAFYKGYADFTCYRNGELCYLGQPENPGDLTAIYRAERYLLNVLGTGTGTMAPSTHANQARATTTRTPNGTVPTPDPDGTKSFLRHINQYLGIVHPFTTGFIAAKNPAGIQSPIFTPQYQGYDTDFDGVEKMTVTYEDWNGQWNQQLSEVTYTTYTHMQYLYDVGRVVSMVRPRLVHTYQKPMDPTKPIKVNWSTSQLQMLKVYFVPEPTRMLLLGAGIAALLGLSRMRRR